MGGELEGGEICLHDEASKPDRRVWFAVVVSRAHADAVLRHINDSICNRKRPDTSGLIRRVSHRVSAQQHLKLATSVVFPARLPDVLSMRGGQ